jgi:hypothetical protein
MVVSSDDVRDARWSWQASSAGCAGGAIASKQFVGRTAPVTGSRARASLTDHGNFVRSAARRDHRARAEALRAERTGSWSKADMLKSGRQDLS